MRVSLTPLASVYGPNAIILGAYVHIQTHRCYDPYYQSIKLIIGIIHLVSQPFYFYHYYLIYSLYLLRSMHVVLLP